MTAADAGLARFMPPTGVETPLEVPPELASWDKTGSWSQVRLARFLDHLEARAAGLPWPAGPATVQLHVALPAATDLLKDRDLDNYLTPVMTRLGGRDIASVWATKALGGQSALRVGEARAAGPDMAADRGFVRLCPIGSASSAAWKHSAYEQLRPMVAMLPWGPVELEISFRVGTARKWQNLWKQSIDPLGPLLGMADPSKPFSPEDGRIVRLGLHRHIDARLGHGVELGVWWRLLEQVPGGPRLIPAPPLTETKQSSSPPGRSESATRGDSRGPAGATAPGASRSTRFVPAAHRPPQMPGGPSGADADVQKFVRDDPGYLRWVADHPDGYVLNCEGSLNPKYLKLHRASCQCVTEFQRGQTTWTDGTYIKVCAARRETIDRWLATGRGGFAEATCQCHSLRGR